MVDLPQFREPECPEEKTARSCLSSGPVLDHEELGRFLYRDDHLTTDGLVAPAALPTTDLLDLSREGLSLGRLFHLTAQDIRRRAAEYEGRHSANRFSGFGVVLTARVRHLLTPHGQRELCVVDDARRGFRAHALVQLADRNAYNRALVRRLRRRLLDWSLFDPRKPSLIRSVHGRPDYCVPGGVRQTGKSATSTDLQQFSDRITEHFATKADLAALETRLIKWMAGIAVAGGGLLSAALRTLG